jgi:hypothetical protein
MENMTPCHATGLTVVLPTSQDNLHPYAGASIRISFSATNAVESHIVMLHCVIPFTFYTTWLIVDLFLIVHTDIHS